MTQMTQPPPAGWTPPPPHDARAQAAAAKAYAKAQRNWFMRHKFLTVIGAILLLGILSSALGSGSTTSQNAPAGSATTSAKGAAPAAAAPATEAGEDAPVEEAAAGIGTPVRDGKFEFTVHSVEPGGSTIGDEPFAHEAQGQFLFVKVSVANIGDEPQSFFGDNQYLYVGQSRYSADSEAAIYLDDAQSLYEEINPGNSLEGVIVFDVPAGAVPTSLELHDSAFSGGVTIDL